jgi:cation-transporting ATPase E
MDGQERLLVLGSYEALRDQFCEVDRELVEGVWREFLSTGKRLIVFAEGVSDGKPLQSRVPSVELRPLALVMLKDELRPGIAGVLAALAFQGIRFKVVSGDHPETVRATVQSVGSAFRNDLIVSGDAWENAADRLAIAREHDLFGRVSPEQKMALVGCLQEAGCNVGMIGDGVNDVLPLKRADFGVAMGSGSPAAKAVAGGVGGVEEVLPPPLGAGAGAGAGMVLCRARGREAAPLADEKSGARA